ncbi:MAG: hypothetical protein RSF67_05660 [Clostridia bacterium]
MRITKSTEVFDRTILKVGDLFKVSMKHSEKIIPMTPWVGIIKAANDNLIRLQKLSGENIGSEITVGIKEISNLTFTKMKFVVDESREEAKEEKLLQELHKITQGQLKKHIEEQQQKIASIIKNMPSASKFPLKINDDVTEEQVEKLKKSLEKILGEEVKISLYPHKQQ